MTAVLMILAVLMTGASLLLLLNKMYHGAWVWLFAAVSVANLALRLN